MTEKLTAPKIDKSTWGPGPWQEEPDRIEWEHLGFPCLMTRTPMGNWCGYVAVPPGHPLFEKHYDSLDLVVHGGLTYADHCQGHICHKPKTGEPENVWWLGFDCAHCNDLIPGIKAMAGVEFMAWGKYRDAPYVKKQVENLAAQIAQTSPK